MWIRMLIGGAVGLVAGGLLGYFGKCSSGSCPLTANPYRGAMFGVIAGIMFALVMGPTEPAGAGNVPHLTTVDAFETKILKANRVVLVDFYSDNCGPCRRLAPTISKLKTQYEGKADVFKVDVTEARELARRYKIRAIPAVMLFDSGEVVDKWVGLQDADVYSAAIDAAIAKPKNTSK